MIQTKCRQTEVITHLVNCSEQREGHANSFTDRGKAKRVSFFLQKCQYIEWSLVTRNCHQRETFNDKEVKKNTKHHCLLPTTTTTTTLPRPTTTKSGRDFHRRTREYQMSPMAPSFSSRKTRDSLEKANRVLNPESFFSPRFCRSLLYFLSSSPAAAEDWKKAEVLHWCKRRSGRIQGCWCWCEGIYHWNITRYHFYWQRCHWVKMTLNWITLNYW